MTFRPGLQLVSWLSALSFSLAFSSPAFASKPVASAVCESMLGGVQPNTLKSLRERNTQALLEYEKTHPLPGFDKIEVEAKNEQVGTIGPLALQQMLGAGQSFVSSPSPGAASDTAVSLHSEGRSFPIHYDQMWEGQRTSTAVYASLPKTLKPHSGTYLVGPEYPVVVIHLHGGGTDMASGKNAMSIGEAIAPLGIPLLGPDLMGHSRATRKLKGLTTFQGMVDWVLAMADQLVDPRVKIVLTGHSWGAEFAVFMQRHSREPKYARIQYFMPLAPPVDASLGGDEIAKRQLEDWYQEHFHEFKDRIAPADFEFLQNILRSGKNSFVGGIFTSLSSMDFSTPPLSLKEQEGLTPQTIVASEADGLCFVGRGEAYLAAYKEQLAPSKFILLGPGRKFSSKDKDVLTGHNCWDRYIDGTTTRQVYQLITEAAQSVGGSTEMTADPHDAAETLVEDFFRGYANFFLFREFIKNRFEYVNVDSKDIQAIRARQEELSKYVGRVEQRRESGNKELEAKLLKSWIEIRTALGLKDGVTPLRAGEELALPPLTDARRLLIEEYLAKFKAVDEEMKVSYVDTEYLQDMAALQKEFAPVLLQLGVEKVEAYRPAFDKLQALRSPVSKVVADQRAALSRLHAKFTEIFKNKLSRSSSERDQRMATVVAPHGITDFKSATRELTVDRSAERRARLTQFLEQAEPIEIAERALSAKALQSELAGLPLPAGVSTLEEAVEMKRDADALTKFSFVPSGDTEVGALVADLSLKRDEYKQILTQIAALEKPGKDLQTESFRQDKAWIALWKSPGLSSPRLREVDTDIATKLEAYAERHYAYKGKNDDWMMELRRSGRATEENLIAQTPELLKLRDEALDSRAAFTQAVRSLDRTRWTEALNGSLEGDAASVAQARQIALKLFGSDFDQPSGESTISRQRTLEDQLEALRRRSSILQQEVLALQWRYTVAMQARGVALPAIIERISIVAALNQPYADLIAALRTNGKLAEALRGTLRVWMEFLASLRSEESLKDVGNY